MHLILFSTLGNRQQENIAVRFISDNKIAYIKIDSFKWKFVKSDYNKLMIFWRVIREYPYLIIDIRGNRGGSDSYWRSSIVKKINNQGLEYKLYIAYRGGDYSLPFIKAKMGEYPLREIEDLHSKPNYPSELKRDFKYYSELIRTINPGPIRFKGKIYLLVDSAVYSAAESFCVFAKATNWATIVGERTGGDGIGINPILAVLPNSGLVVRFPVSFGVNPDGSANEEYHTVPDIEAVDPLKEVLNIINNQ